MRIPYKIVSFAELMSATCSLSKAYADTETEGLYGKFRLIQVMQEGWTEVLVVDRPAAHEVMTFVNANDVVWQNAHYDLTTVQEQLGGLAWVPERITDTLLLGRLALPRLTSHSLDDLLFAVLKRDPYKGFNKKAMQKSDWSGKLTEEQLQYAVTDVFYMPELYNAIKHAEDTPNYQLDILTLKYCLDFQWNGMPVDPERLEDLARKQHDIILDIALPINCNSWQQVRPYIGSEESDDLALAKLELAGNEKAGAVRKTRKAKKLLSFLAKFDVDVILGKFKPAAKSGRLTSLDQNLQQLPRKSKCVFGVGEDEVMIFADYAQLELRTACSITNCIAMAKLFRDGVDLHAATRDMIFGDAEALAIRNPGADLKALQKLYRQVTKTANFNLLYGGGVGMFIDILIKSAEILLSVEEASMVKRKWLNLWVEISRWQQKRIAEFNSGKLGRTPLGREYMAERMTDFMNIENQGAGAEVAKLALHYLHKFGFKTLFPEFRIRNFIHDSFIITGPADPVKYKACAEFLAKVMQRAWFEMSKCFTIKDLPMPVEVAVGRNWGDIESDDVPNLFDYVLEPYNQLGVEPDAPI